MKRQVCDGGVRSLDSPELKEQVKGEGRMVPVREKEGSLLGKLPGQHQWLSHHQLKRLVAKAESQVTPQSSKILVILHSGALHILWP